MAHNYSFFYRYCSISQWKQESGIPSKTWKCWLWCSLYKINANVLGWKSSSKTNIWNDQSQTKTNGRGKVSSIFIWMSVWITLDSQSNFYQEENSFFQSLLSLKIGHSMALQDFLICLRFLRLFIDSHSLKLNLRKTHWQGDKEAFPGSLVA